MTISNKTTIRNQIKLKWVGYANNVGDINSGKGGPYYHINDKSD